MHYHCTVFHNWKPILKLSVRVSERHSGLHNDRTQVSDEVMTGSQIWHTT